MDITAELVKLQRMEERLEDMEEKLQVQASLMEQLRSENKALKTMVETKLESMEKENEARKVAFSASLLDCGSGHTGPFDYVTSPLIYKKVFTNFGNCYDSSTGIFTAPLKGVYYFRFYAHSHGGTKMAVSLYKNAEVMCSVFSWKPESNGNASNGIILTLDKGDMMFTKLRDNSWVFDDPGHYTSFSGLLLFPL